MVSESVSPITAHPNAAAALGSTPEMVDATLENFLSRLSIPDHKPSTCWPWQGYKQAGYGRFNWSGNRWRASRFALAVETGEYPSGLFALHHCDNPPCCRPSHLYWGTQKDNVRDAVERDRIAFGERVTVSKLTTEQVEDIRQSYQFGVRGHGLRQLARKYDLTVKTVQRIVRGEDWQRALTKQQRAEQARARARLTAAAPCLRSALLALQEAAITHDQGGARVPDNVWFQVADALARTALSSTQPAQEDG